MDLFKKSKSVFWWYDFTVCGRRYRGSTKEITKTAASIAAAQILIEARQGKIQSGGKPPKLVDFAEWFMTWLDSVNLAEKSRKYYRSGWKLLKETKLANMRLHHIASEDIDALRFPGGASYANCALRTLKRMLHKARERGQLSIIPKIRMFNETGRHLLLDENAERRLLAHASPLLRDVIILMRETGMRNKKELFCMRIEDIHWADRAIFVPRSKTPKGRRFIPLTERAENLLMVRCRDRREGWVFPAKRSKSGHLENIDKEFRKAREAAGLPEKLVLYCGRHDYGTRVLQATGNLAAVMSVMGHADTRSAIGYQHPGFAQVRDALNAERGADGKKRVN